MSDIQQALEALQRWFDGDRFAGITRLYGPRQILEQRGTISVDYPVARVAADEFYALLQQYFSDRKAITTFGPYSPGQAVAMKRMGILGIYLGGWATSAKGSLDEDPGPDLASYPLSQVPNEAALLVRALLAADKNQQFARMRMSPADQAKSPAVDYRPFIIADADTGHGGEAHVRNLVRRFAEVGVPGYHIEDQKPGVKKCGHQAGKVLVPVDEQVKRLNAARFQLDVMGVPGIIVARTDAEAATFLDGRADERDHPFILGATNIDLPSFKTAYLAVLRQFNQRGVKELNGHLLYRISDTMYQNAERWLERCRLLERIDESIAALEGGSMTTVDAALDNVVTPLLETWQMEAGLKTYAQAVADVMAFRIDEGFNYEMSAEEWLQFADNVSFQEARDKARAMGITIIWDCDLPKTPEGYYQIQGGIPYAIARSLAAAPFADILWMETKTAHLGDAKTFADAIHEQFPDKMLAYNLSPSFNWDTTGMNDDQMRQFPEELGKLGFVFNFITYGGHQVDGLAGEEFATALKQDGMLALARLQRKLRLVDSPYKTPQTYVGGPRVDGALMASSGRTATTKAMGKGSTQFQHLIQTEVPPKVLEQWIEIWRDVHGIKDEFSVTLKPHTAGSELLELALFNGAQDKVASVVFATIQDRRDRNILSVRDQNTFETSLRRKRLMLLIHLFLIYRYKSHAVHYVSPTEDNDHQTQRMQALGFFSSVDTEIGQIIVAIVNETRIAELTGTDQQPLMQLINKKD